MSLDTDLLDKSLALPPELRAELAHRLLASIDEGGPDDDPAWIAEIDRRLDQADAGEVVGLPRDQAMRQMREALSGERR